MNVSVTTAPSPKEGHLPDLYVTVVTTDETIPDWPTTRAYLLEQNPTLFTGYAELPSDWRAGESMDQHQNFVDIWMVVDEREAKEVDPWLA